MSVSSNFWNPDFCGNCSSSILTETFRNVITIRLEDELVDEVLILDAIAYIYGISSEKLQNLSCEYANCSLDKVSNDPQVTFCDTCASLLTENYKSHKLFETRIHTSSFVEKVKNFRGKELTSETRELNENILSLNISNVELSNPVFHEEENSVEHETSDHAGDSNLFEDFNFEELEDAKNSEMSKAEEGIEEKYEVDQGASQESDVNESCLLRRSTRMKTVVVKLEKLSADDLQSQFGINIENFGNFTGKKRRKRALSRRVHRTVKKSSAIKIENSLKNSTKVFKKPTKSKTYPCKVCGKVLTDRYNYLYKHLPNHYKRSTFICDICGKVLKSINGLKGHKNLVHADEEKKSKLKSACEICSKVMWTYTLKAHMATKHSGPRETYRCEPCDRVFISQKGYSDHMLTHSEDFAPNLCIVCGKTFTLVKSLKLHELTHSGERKYCCDVCPMKFFVKCELTRHKRRVHTTERKWVCDKCGRSYKSDQHLRQHSRLHKEIEEKGVKSTQCKKCGKFFRHSVSLHAHTRKFHRPDLKKRIYKCGYCEKTLSSATILRNHEILHKNDPGYRPRKKQTFKDNILS